MNSLSNDPRVDELRKQLRALGYLDAGVDRFVLGPARSARSPWAIAALSSLRVGALAAILLGPVVAAGIGARLPGLVTGPRDAIVVALYLAVMFGIAATLFAFVASVLVATVGGASVSSRPRLVSRAAGTLVAMACLAYLTLWWRSANAETWSAPVWTSFALLIAVLVSILIGHAVAITTFAVIAARHPTSLSARVAPAASTRLLVVAAGMAAFAGAASLLLVAAPGGNAAPERPTLAVVSPGLPVLLVGIDGFDPQIFESLRASGQVPALARLAAAGSVRIAADDERDPARAWTTIATGQPPDVHGVHSLETRRVAGLEGRIATGQETGVGRAVRAATDLFRLTRPAIASGSELRTKTFWEVAADAGLRAVVVNWWATWPAVSSGEAAPVILSDRATLRLEHGGTLDAEIAPPELYEPVRAKWNALKQDAADAVGELMVPPADPAIAKVIRRSAELDTLQFAMAAALPKSPVKSDLLAIYLPGLDIAQHTLLVDGAGAPASTLEARLDAVRGYYVFLDKLLAPLLEPADTLVVLVTQPGRLTSRLQGVFAMHGGAVASSWAGEIRPIDVAATILYALGVPISSELSGRAVTELFSPAFVAKFPVRNVATYGPRRLQGAAREGQPLDAEMIERLRSLGYVR